MDVTWHARPRGPTRVPTWHGCDMHIIYIYHTYGYNTYKHFIFRTHHPFNLPHLINPVNSLHFIRVGLCSLVFLSFKRRGEAWIAGSKAREMARVDRMDARSTRSLSKHVP